MILDFLISVLLQFSMSRVYTAITSFFLCREYFSREKKIRFVVFFFLFCFVAPILLLKLIALHRSVVITLLIHRRVQMLRGILRASSRYQKSSQTG